MELSIASFLQPAPAAGAANVADAEVMPDGAASFAALMQDANAQSQQQRQQGGSSAALGGLVPMFASPIATTTDTVQIPVLTREDTAALNHAFTQMGQGNQGDEPLQKALEETLEQLESLDAGAEVPMPEMVAQLPVVQQTTNAQERSALSTRILQFLQQALGKEATPVALQAPTTLPQKKNSDPLAEAVQASMFRTAALATPAPTPSAESTEASSPAAVTAQSYAAPLLAGAAAFGVAEQKSPEKSDGKGFAIPKWIQDLGSESSDALPEVTLPGAEQAPTKPSHAKELTGATVQASVAAARELLAPLPDSPSADTSNPLVQATAMDAHAIKLDATATARPVAVVAHAPAFYRTEMVEQIHVGIRKVVQDGVDRITIQLDPVDLGRVEVKMDMSQDGLSRVIFTADRQDTLDVLQRDARSLERALQEAGVKADSGSMEFNLRQQPQHMAGGEFGQGGQGHTAPQSFGEAVDAAIGETLEDATRATNPSNMQLTYRVDRGVDLKI